MNTCKEGGCISMAHTRGLCARHYQSALKAGKIKRIYQSRKRAGFLRRMLTPPCKLGLTRLREVIGSDIDTLYLRREEIVPFVFNQVQQVLKEADACILVLPDNDLVPHALRPTHMDLYISLGHFLGLLNKDCTPEDVSAMIYGG